jgi:putative MFS transporter
MAGLCVRQPYRLTAIVRIPNPPRADDGAGRTRVDQLAVGTPDISARLDRLPGTRYLWFLVFLLALGAFFEIYDIGLSAPLSLGLLQVGIFHRGAQGLFGLTDQATFLAATFAGLYIGTLGFSFFADRIGRRPIFTVALLWYAAATVIMGLQSSAIAIDVWRLVAGVGVGMELVAIDCYVAELMPARLRGRAFAFCTSIQFLSAPIGALLAWRLIPHGWLGVDGWRWMTFVPGVAAVLVWWIRRALPESPRWLSAHGRAAEAEAVTAMIEDRVAREAGHDLPLPLVVKAPTPEGRGAFAEMWRPPYRRRTLALTVFHLFQTVGYFGFANWLPLLLLSQGVTLAKTLAYGVAIALVPPLAPALFGLISDRFERKWLIAVGALVAATCGLGLSAMTQTSNMVVFVALGVGVAAGNSLMSLSYHTYQSEVFPTRIRARAVGFVYSFSRLSALFSSYIIAFILDRSGSLGVFVLISSAMLIVAITIGGFGPRTRGRPLDAI